MTDAVKRSKKKSAQAAVSKTVCWITTVTLSQKYYALHTGVYIK